MDPRRGSKRVRSDDLFFKEQVQGNGGVYLKIRLSSGKSLKSKGWPWVQLGVRGVLGGSEKVEKASFLSDGSLLVKTKNNNQTEKFLSMHSFANEECVVVRDERLNMSKGTIHAYDLIDLSEDEVVGWLREFGVVGAKRFTRKNNGNVENTPTLLLTFDAPSCPNKLQLDYVTYHVSRYIPNPLMCYRCGRFGHPEVRCRNDQLCLQCGKGKHEGQCTTWCVNCKKAGHSCLSRECEVWIKEKDICRIKVEQEMSYVQARKQYEGTHAPPPPVLKAYAAVARTPSAASKQDDEMKDKVGRLEKQMGEMIQLLQKLLTKDKDTTETVSRTATDSVTDMQERQNSQETDSGKTEEEMGMGTEGNQNVNDGELIDIIQVQESNDDGQMAEVNQESRGRQVDNWQIVGKRRQREKDVNKGLGSVPGVEITPSPQLNRPTKAKDRSISRQRSTKKAWTDEGI